MRRELERLANQSAELQGEAIALGRGQRVRIISDYNGQPYGRSKPSWKGRVETVTDVILEPGSVELVLNHWFPTLRLYEVEFLGPEPTEEG